MWNWIEANKQWLFSGAGVVLLGLLFRALWGVYGRLRRAVATLPKSSSMSHLSPLAVANPRAIAKLATILNVHLSLYQQVFLTRLKVQVLLRDDSRYLFERLRSENPLEDLSEFWLLYIAKQVSNTRPVEQVVDEHVKLPGAELRLRIASSIVDSLATSPSRDVGEYIETFPPLLRALDKMNSESDERQGAAVQELEAFLRSPDPTAVKLGKKIDNYIAGHAVDRAKVVATIASYGRASEKHGVTLTDTFRQLSRESKKQFEMMVDLLSAPMPDFNARDGSSDT